MAWQLKTFEELSKTELYDILKLRNQVFIVEQECAYLDIDDRDLDALHLFKYIEGQMAGYCRLYCHSTMQGTWCLGRIVIARPFRGQKLAYKLVFEAKKVCVDQYKAKGIFIQAQTYLRKFYESLGFVAICESYLEDNIPHIDMLHHVNI